MAIIVITMTPKATPFFTLIFQSGIEEAENMEYYINIAKNGRFYCRVEFGEGMPGEADAKAAKVRELFKADEGFNCTLHARETTIHLCKENFGEAWR